jgi:hypothetical protein
MSVPFLLNLFGKDIWNKRETVTGKQCLLFKSEQDDLQELQYLSALCKVRNSSQKYSKMGLVWGCSGLVWFSRHFTEDFSLPVCHSDQSKVVKIYISFPLQPILNIYKKSIIISASQKVYKQLFAFIIGKECYDFICTISWSCTNTTTKKKTI